VAGPTTTGVRSIHADHPAQGLTPDRLAHLLRDAEQGNAIAYLELAEELEEKDLHYQSVLGTRKRAVTQLPIEVDAASDDPEHEKDAQLVRDWLNRDTLETELFDILDAIGKGFSATEIVWQLTARSWLPCRLKWRDPRWFEFDRTDGETLYLRDGAGPQPLSAFKYIVHVHPAKTGLPIRGGLARSIAWMYLIKNFSIKDWATFMDAYGMPLRVGKYENGTPEEHIRVLMRALSMLGSDAAAAIPKSMDIEFIDRKGGENGDVFERLAKFADLQMSKAVLGQTSSADATAGGLGSGQANEHGEVRGDIKRADAKLIAATLNRDLVVPMVMLNRGRRDAYPRLRIGKPEADDIKTFLETVKTAVDLGVEVGVSSFRRLTGLPEPKPGEELLQRAAPQSAPGDPNAPGGPRLRKGRRTPLLEALKPSYRLVEDDTASARSMPELPADEIDVAAAGALADWQRRMKPLIGPIEELVAGATSLEEIRDRLASTELGDDEIRELLARAAFGARLAGDADTPQDGD